MMDNNFLAVDKRWLSNPNVTLLQKLIIAQVTEYMRNGKECYMTDQQFADAFGVNVQQVTRAIKALSDNKMLLRDTKTVSNNGQASKTRTLKAIVKFDYSLDKGIVTSDNTLPEAIVTDDYSLEGIVKNDRSNSQNDTEGIVTSDNIKDNIKDNIILPSAENNFDYLFVNGNDEDIDCIVDDWEANMDTMTLDEWIAKMKAEGDFQGYTADEVKAIIDYYSL